MLKHRSLLDPYRKMESKNIHWLVGDRFVCAFHKRRIVKELSKGGGWEVVEFTTEKSESFLSTINQSSIFGNSKYIFIHEGSLPEQSKTVPFLEKFSEKKDKVLIVMEGDEASSSKPDKRTTMFKKFGDSMTFFEPVIQPNGFPDKNLIPNAIEILINMFFEKYGEKLNKKMLGDVFESTRYDFGKTFNEIEKASIYLGATPKSFDEMFDIASFSTGTIDEAVGQVLRGECHSAIDTINKIMIDNDSENENFMLFLYSLAENTSFFLHCNNAIESGINSPSGIGEFVAQHFIKKDKPVDAFSSEKRYVFLKNQIKSYSVKALVMMNKKIEECLFNYKIKGMPRKFLINDLIFNISIISAIF